MPIAPDPDMMDDDCLDFAARLPLFHRPQAVSPLQLKAMKAKKKVGLAGYP